MLKSLLHPAFALLYLAACHDENPPCMDPTNPHCPNFDSCLVFVPANAAFTVFDSLSGISCFGQPRQDLVFETDTCAGVPMLLHAEYPADRYYWIVGSDTTIYRSRSFRYDFGWVQDSMDVPVRLITCKTPPLDCQIDACDTVDAFIHLIPVDLGESAWSYVIGSFKGAGHGQDSFIITIPPILPTLQGIINFPEGCLDQYLEVSVYRHGFIINEGPTFCASVCGIGRIQEDRKTLIIDYTTKHIDSNYILYIVNQWRGRRL